MCRDAEVAALCESIELLGKGGGVVYLNLVERIGAKATHSRWIHHDALGALIWLLHHAEPTC